MVPMMNELSVAWGRYRCKEGMKGRMETASHGQANGFIYNSIRNFESRSFQQESDIQIRYRKTNLVSVEGGYVKEEEIEDLSQMGQAIDKDYARITKMVRDKDQRDIKDAD